MNTILRATALVLLATTLGMPAAGPPTAQQVLDRAKAQAAGQHKDILLLFEASW